MLPAAALYNDIANEIAASSLMANTYAVRVVIAPFSPALDLVIGDLTYGTGDLAQVEQTLAGPVVGINPLTGGWQIIMTEPAGGYKWTVAGVTPVLPVTVYGFALIDVTDALLLATEALDAPLILTTPGTVVAFHNALFNLLVPPMQ